MNNVSLGKKRSALRALLVFIVTLGMTVPTLASALTVQPAQILPPAPGTACSAVTFSEVIPHIYNGNLDSFDLTVSDSRYVSVATSINNMPIGYRYTTRWNNPDGSVRIHVDLPSLRMNKDAHVEVALLAASTNTTGAPITCGINFASIIPAVPGLITDGHKTPIYIPIIHTPTPTTPDSSSTSTTKTPDVTGKTVGLVAVTNSLGKLCANGGSTRLWVILLILCAVFVITLLMQKIEPGDLGKEWNIALILGIFLALLVFWYVSSVCRAGPWAPAFATLIAVSGLIYTTLQPDEAATVLLLKDGRK